MTSPFLLSLATLLAQAAAADPGPGPAAPPPVLAPAAPKPTGPAEPAPPETTGPAEPAPSEPAPSGVPSPAPSPFPPPSPYNDLGPETPPRNIVALLGGVAYRLTSTALSPSIGFSIGGSYQRRYATLASAVELGWAVEFAFDRFATGVIGSAPDANGVEQTYAATRTITSTSFAALQTLAVHQDRFRFWAGAGAGLSIGFLSSPELDLRPGSASAYQPLARGAAGADVEINSQASVGLRAGYSFMLTSSALHTDNGPSFAFMGDLLDIQAGLFYRFH
jgi:hypothetical protein